MIEFVELIELIGFVELIELIGNFRFRIADCGFRNDCSEFYLFNKGASGLPGFPAFKPKA